LEELVLTQVRNALAAPHVVQAAWDRVRQIAPDITEPQVVLPMHNLATVWQQLFAPEQYRLERLVVERVELGSTGVEIVWRDAGWQTLTDELRPGTIGAELAELEATV
jgi:hypothetical protein